MLRFFLSDPWKGTIFEGLQGAPTINREEYLRAQFGSKISFEHRRQSYVYRPYPSEPSSPYLVDVIARESTVTVAKSADEGFVKEDVENWDAANVFIDVTPGDDGQKVAMQAPPSIRRSYSSASISGRTDKQRVSA